MAKSNALKMKLPSVDDLFSTEESRQEAKLTKIYDIPISEIDDFPDHPYKVLDDDDMQALMDSISERGVITPAMVRKKDDSRYEMISGHRRKHACKRLGLETLRCEIVDVSRDEAIILMVDSNILIFYLIIKNISEKLLNNNRGTRVNLSCLCCYV